MKKYLYFAYGSNLHVEQMGGRCPGAEGVSPAVLEGWRLVERGYADIEPAEGACVHGALYLITDDDLAALDLYEGYPEFYLRREVTVTDPSGAAHAALVYLMTDRYKKGLENQPYTEGYRAVCSAGAAHWRIPDAFSPRPRGRMGA